MVREQTFPVYLRQELLRRRSRNIRYSLRAFALLLGVSPSFLSKVMNGKKAVSEETFMKMASRLHLDDDQIEIFRVKLPGFKPSRMIFTPVDADRFQYISDWHHYAILEAVTLEDFEASPEWLGRKFGISEHRARIALNRLLRLGYLSRKPSGEIARKVENHTTAALPTPSGACREHERQILELAIQALDGTDISRRDQSSMTLAIPSSRITEAREKIDQFRREMCLIAEASVQSAGGSETDYRFQVFEVKRPVGTAGGAMEYRGTSFDLSVETDSLTNADRSFPAQASLSSAGIASKALNCQF